MSKKITTLLCEIILFILTYICKNLQSGLYPILLDVLLTNKLKQYKINFKAISYNFLLIIPFIYIPVAGCQ